MITDTDRKAARQYLELDYARHSLAGEPAQAAHRQAEEIAAKHEHAQDLALVGTAQDLGEIPKHLRIHQARERKKAGIDKEHAARIRATYRQPAAPTRPRSSSPSSSPAPRPSRTPASPVRRARSAGGRLAGFTGASDAGAGATLLTALGWGIGLSILYVALVHAERLSTITNGAVRATRAIVAVNVDPLNPHGPLGHAHKKG